MFYKDKYGGLVKFLSNRIKTSVKCNCFLNWYLSAAGAEESNHACIDCPLTMRTRAVPCPHVNREQKADWMMFKFQGYQHNIISFYRHAKKYLDFTKTLTE